MNTSKQVNVMVGLLMVFLVGTLLYFLWDSARADDATKRQLRVDAERGGALYSLNCRSCHGITGLGGQERGGLPGAPLNVDSSRPTSKGDLALKQQRFRDTIRCGRIGTLMPQWSLEQGGALNDYQIEQLVTLITSAASEEGWKHAVEVADGPPSHRPAGDQFEPRKFLAEAASESGGTLALTDAGGVKVDDILRVGSPAGGEKYELVKVTGVQEGSTDVQVERGVEGSQAAAHDAGTEVFKGPILPPTGPRTGEQTLTPPCGQKAPVPAATPGPAIQVSGTVDVEMGDNFFKIQGQQNPSLDVTAGQAVTFNIKNNGNVPHNMRIAGPDSQFNTDDDTVSAPDLIPPGTTATLTVTIPAAGANSYRCDFHPLDMKGDITVK